MATTDVKRIDFSPADEDRLAGLALWGRIAAITTIVSSLADAGALVYNLRIPLTINIIVTLVVRAAVIVALVIASASLFSSCGYFHKVARTDEADQHYLREGFTRLGTYFKILGVLMIIGIVCAAVLLILAVFFGGAFLRFGT